LLARAAAGEGGWCHMFGQGCFFGADLAGLLAAGVAVAVRAEAAPCDAADAADAVDDAELCVAV
jgi:hypothetical protein